MYDIINVYTINADGTKTKVGFVMIKEEIPDGVNEHDFIMENYGHQITEMADGKDWTYRHRIDEILEEMEQTEALDNNK